MIKDLEEQSSAYCRFCNPQEKERIIYESDNFYVMLSLGPIVEGYCLLVTKQHFSCCGAIPFDLRDEFTHLYSKIHDILNKVYGACISYEHGRAGACLIPSEGSKHCFHAHMHFVPIDSKLNKAVERDFDDLILTNLNQFFEAYEQNAKQPYLFVDDMESISMYFVDKPLRRQYLRYKAAVSIGKEHLWDWVNHQGWDLINSALKVLPKYFKQL